MADEGDPRQRVATNQAPPLLGHDPVAGDPSLVGPVRAYAGGATDRVLDSLAGLAAAAGTAEASLAVAVAAVAGAGLARLSRPMSAAG